MIVALMTFITLMTTLASSVSDIRALRIPNWHVLIILVSFVIAFATSPESFGRWWEHVAAFSIFLAITFVMFHFNMLGAGDAKFGAVLALWTGLQGFMPLVFYMSLAGGLLGAVALHIKKKKPFKNPGKGSFVAEVQEGKNAVPYGVAITIGLWASFLHTGFVHQQIDELVKIIH